MTDSIKNDVIIQHGQVEDIEDPSNGMRIKVRLNQDGSIDKKDLPYAFPLLPKTFQSMPKKGEGVFVILSKQGNTKSNRYYIGPIISQSQKNKFSVYDYSRGAATSLIQGGETRELGNIDNYPITEGSFPQKEDVSVIGRKSEDIILKEGEIDLRCGIRKEGYNEHKEDLKGDIIFNKIDPAYIQMKYKNSLSSGNETGANSIINIVADKINIISNQDENGFNLTDPKELIKSDDITNIMKSLHKVPHGDKLISLLEKMINAIITHTHPFSMLPPYYYGYVADIGSEKEKLESLLSKHVRIS